MSADDYPGPDGETLRRQRLPGAAERWEALPWENRMALLGGLAEEAAEHRRDATGAEGCQSVDTPPVMRERYAALAVTYETAHAALMRADTVSSKDKSPDEVAAERAKYAAPADDRAAIVAFIRAEETKYEQGAKSFEPYALGSSAAKAAARVREKAAALRTVAAYIERGDHLNGDVK